MDYERIRVDHHPDYEDRVVRITLSRPEVHNAFDEGLIVELTHALQSAGEIPAARVVLLCAEGKTFCAGADVNWLKRSLGYTEEENLADARKMQGMFRAFVESPLPVVGRIHGHAIGGGAGLTAACDIAIAKAGVKFGFTEVRLGILPAVISPFVLRKLSMGRARPFFLTGERFEAERAYEIGLVHGVCESEEELDQAVGRTIEDLCAGGPRGIARVKRMLLEMEGMGPEDRYRLTASTIAEVRVGEEGQAGLRAFLEKENPPWKN